MAASFEGLRIGLVGPLPPPAGGMATQTCQLAGLLRGAGAFVTLVQTNTPYRPSWIAGVPMVRAFARLLPYLVALLRAADHSDVFHVMANSGWSWHLFARPAIWAGRLRGVPVVVNYRGGEAEAFLRRAHSGVRRTLSHCAALVVPSGFLQAVFSRNGIEAGILPNIVDLTRFRPAEITRPRGAHLVVARNLEAIYDNETAINALALVRKRHPETRLTVAGTGPEHAILRRRVDELGLGNAVRFAGRLDRDGMAELYRDADIALNPSTVDNMPNSVLEALASGVPVVSTHVGGIPHMVKDGESALLVPPRDPQAMASAVMRLLEDSGLAKSLARAGLVEAQRYAWERVAGLLAEVYRRAAGSSRVG